VPDDQHRVVDHLVDELRSSRHSLDEALEPRIVAAVERIECIAIARGDAMISSTSSDATRLRRSLAFPAPTVAGRGVCRAHSTVGKHDSQWMIPSCRSASPPENITNSISIEPKVSLRE
jgi:hypothetical protein